MANRQVRRAGRPVWAVGLVGLGLVLGACSRSDSPDANDPYAGGQSYPWSDRLDTPAGDPYAGGRSYPWVGAHAPAPGLQAADVSNENYLSDLTWTSAQNAWGPIEKDRSNGDKLGGDGRTLTVGGQTFAKGLGVHANSEVSYALGGMCNVFTAQVGVDDEVGSAGSVVFQVWSGTATKLYDSGLLRGTDAARAVSVDVTGVQNLRLVITDGGNGISSDHADWAEAKVSCPARQPSGDNFLSDLPWTLAQNNWGPIERDLSNGEKALGDGRALTVGGQTFTKGLGVHAVATVAYALGARCTTFTAQVGLDDEVGDRGSVVFQVFGDGVKLYESPVRRGVDPALPVSVNVSGVQELRLVTDSAGDGASYDHADWAEARVSCATDTTPPAAPGGLTAVPGADGIALDWGDNTEADLGGYLVFRAALPDGPFTALTPQPVAASAYSDPAPEGVRSYYQVVAVDTSGNRSLPATASAIRTGTGTATLEVENLDGGPWPDRLVFSRIGSLTAPPSNGVHNLVTVRLKSTGTSMLRVSALTVGGPWAVDPAVTLPLDIPTGGHADVRLRFTAEATKGHFGTLTVGTNDAATPNRVVQLAGLWQSLSEQNQEPNIFQIRDAFGYTFGFLGGETTFDQLGLVRAQGDEVLAPYWQRADETQPVTVRQLAAYHTQGQTATLSWHDKRNATALPVLTHAGVDGQSVLPRLNGSQALAVAGFTPTVPTFGLKVDGEWSDPRRNSQTADRSAGCARPCGQHLRFYRAKDRAGAVMPNTYFMIMDYAGINYDYNDNIYVIGNIKPAPVLLNVGGPTFTDPAGNVWLSDRDQNGDAPYLPASAVNEGNHASGIEIAGTDNDLLYRTYRGNVGTVTPRQIVYNVPIDNGTYLVRLHFADLAHTTAGRRVFDVTAEGTLRLDDLDIVARSGGGRTALAVDLPGVTVSDGKLTLDLAASVDYPALSGVEIVR
ncbi:NPCBM/NEW2 domain-containing protein [Deinococcus sp. YIM 134068]|uniref:NPCBM/NEW2 domain-containing protein n=1 Tax=Deinococcus lichenicola TaxID=3118910 RepID=UPI002F953E78